MEALDSNQTFRELPRYKSHKIVHALKIKDIEYDRELAQMCAPTRETDGSIIIHPAIEGYAPFRLDHAYAGKHKPRIGGYYIQYADGYESYSPAEAFESGYTRIESGDTTPKTLENSDISGAKKNVPDIKVVGNGDAFQLLCKASSASEGWMKSTKAMEIPGVGCVVQVTTQQRNTDGSYAVAEAVTFVPDVKIVEDENNGRKLTR